MNNFETVYPPCKKCGASHGMGIENMETGHIEPLDIWYDCLWDCLWSGEDKDNGNY